MGRRLDSRTVKLQIETAFVGVSYPGDDQLISSPQYYDAAQARDAFKGRKWKELDVDFLRRNKDALGCFTPLAFRYFLPAFMIISLLEPRRSDVIPLYVCLALGPPKDTDKEMLRQFERRMSVFSPSQRSAIASFLMYASEYAGSAEARHALRRYWSRQIDQT
jgi:hypothetical protein